MAAPPFSAGGQLIAHTMLPSGLSLSGDVTAAEDMTIYGKVDGRVTLPEHDLTVASTAAIKGRIVARSVVVSGHVEGNILAEDRIHLRAGASVRGHLTTSNIVLEDGATFTGTVDPDRNESAMRIARYRERQAG